MMDKFRSFALWVIIGLVLIALFNLFQNTGQRLPGLAVAYSQFLTDVNSGKVRAVTIVGQQITGTYSDMTTFNTYSPGDPTLVQRLTERNIQINARPPPEGGTSLIGMLISWGPVLLILAVWGVFMRQLGRTEGKALGSGKQKAKPVPEVPAIPASEAIAIRVLRLPHAAGLPLPAPRTPDSAGCDLAAAVDQPVTIAPGARALTPTGFIFALPPGTEGQVRPRSGLAAEHGVTVLNAPGTIDADYRGEVKVLLVNLGDRPFAVTRGMRIAQLIVARVGRAAISEVFSLEDTARGTGGFGSTGISD